MLDHWKLDWSMMMWGCEQETHRDLTNRKRWLWTKNYCYVSKRNGDIIMTINDSNILKGPKHRVQIDFYRLVNKSFCAWNASYQARKYNPIIAINQQALHPLPMWLSVKSVKYEYYDCFNKQLKDWCATMPWVLLVMIPHTLLCKNILTTNNSLAVHWARDCSAWRRSRWIGILWIVVMRHDETWLENH